MLGLPKSEYMYMSISICGDDIIPIKFKRHCGVRDHVFRIGNPRIIGRVDPWPCHVLFDDHWVHLHLPSAEFSAEVEALSLLSSLDGETERRSRYIAVHSAYEAVVSDRDVDFSSLRHALVHPSIRLNRPSVRESLHRRFNSLEIDLRNYYHQKEYYRCIGRMLIAIDKAIYNAIQARWDMVC